MNYVAVLSYCATGMGDRSGVVPAISAANAIEHSRLRSGAGVLGEGDAVPERIQSVVGGLVDARRGDRDFRPGRRKSLAVIHQPSAVRAILEHPGVLQYRSHSTPSLHDDTHRLPRVLHP